MAETGLSEEWKSMDVWLKVLRGLLIFAVVITAAIGWLVLQPDMPRADAIQITALTAAQMVAYFLKGLLDEEETTAKGYLTGHNVLHTIDISCFMLIIFLVTRHINRAPYFSEGQHLDHLDPHMFPEDRSVFRAFRLKQLRQLYITFLSFEFLPRLVVYLGKLYTPLHLHIAIFLLRELLIVAFYALMCNFARGFIAGASPSQRALLQKERYFLEQKMGPHSQS
eukprot:gene14524-17168_t